MCSLTHRYLVRVLLSDQSDIFYPLFCGEEERRKAKLLEMQKNRLMKTEQTQMKIRERGHWKSSLKDEKQALAELKFALAYRS